MLVNIIKVINNIEIRCINAIKSLFLKKGNTKFIKIWGKIIMKNIRYNQFLF